MSEPLKLAIAGLGRMGWVHARNILEMSAQDGNCRIVALVDSNRDRAERDSGRWKRTDRRSAAEPPGDQFPDRNDRPRFARGIQAAP